MVAAKISNPGKTPKTMSSIIVFPNRRFILNFQQSNANGQPAKKTDCPLNFPAESIPIMLVVIAQQQSRPKSGNAIACAAAAEQDGEVLALLA
ncbi:MAG: hypothetical protein AAF590_09745, partial [Pseudomonadota bacterium]